jgi:peptidoglycan/xylan/chitin deacetylase (PgdA/CDA1 family)
MTGRDDTAGRYQYSPTTRRPDARWPGGQRLAVYVAIGVEAYRFGAGQTEDLLPGVPAPDLVNTAWRDYGNRVGAFRLLDRFAEFAVPPTVLLNTMVYETAPAVTDAARAAGAEIVGHGISNSDSLAGMDPAAERAYLTSVSTAIETHEGERPGGWSSPWLAHTPTTIDSLAATGYRYLLDLRPDDQPVWLTTATGPLLSIPYALELNDSTTIIGRQVTAADFADMIVDEFDDLLDTATGHPVVMSVVLHSFISGVPFRLRPLTRALRHIGARRDEVWLTQPRHIHRAFAALDPPDPGPAHD